MHDVFISYSKFDKAVADTVVQYLEERGIRCWYAPRDVKPGDIWEAKITSAIQQAKFFVLIFSQNSNISNHVMNEVSVAFKAKCEIIPFRLDSSETSKGLSYYLTSVHWLEATDDDLWANAGKLCSIIKGIDPPPPPPPPPPKRRWLKILLLAVALAVGAFFLTQNMIQDMYFFCISHNGTRTHPSSLDIMLSGDQEQIVLQDRDSGNLVSVSVENPYRTNWEAENKIDNPLGTYVIQTESNPYVYFVDNVSKVLHVFDKNRWEYMTDKIQLSDLKEWEIIVTYVFFTPNLTTDSHTQERVVCFSYDVDPEVHCFSKLITLSPEGVMSTVSISHLELVDLVCTFDDNQPEELVLMMDRENHLVLLNIQDGTVVTTDVRTIYETYLPDAQTAHDDSKVSPNKRYMISRNLSWNGYGDGLTVWDMKTGARVFKYENPDLCDAYFDVDSSLVYYDHIKNALFTIKPVDEKGKMGNPVCVLDEDYFEDNKSFLDVISHFYYSKQHQACFFVSESIGFMDKGLDIVVTVTDLNGKVLARSDKISVEYMNVASWVILTEDTVILVIDSQNEKPVCNEEHTTIYRALYTVDSNGKLQFQDDYY